MTATLVQVPDYGSAEWVAKRREGMGASDMASIVGLDPWKGGYELALSKRGEADDIEQSWVMRMGHIMEPYGLDFYEQEHGTITRGETWHNDRWPHCWATLDGRRDDVGIEVKWTNAWREVPRHIVIQCYAQMGIADLARVDVVRISAREAPEVVATIERDEQVIVDLLDTAEAWYIRYVLGDEMPPVDDSRGASRHLDKLRGDEERVATDQQVQLLDSLRTIRARLAEDERADRLIVNELKATMADTGILVAPSARVTWAATKGRSKTDWRKVAQMLRGDMPAERFDALAERHTTTSEPSTRFAVKFEEET